MPKLRTEFFCHILSANFSYHIHSVFHKSTNRKCLRMVIIIKFVEFLRSLVYSLWKFKYSKIYYPGSLRPRVNKIMAYSYTHILDSCYKLCILRVYVDGWCEFSAIFTQSFSFRRNKIVITRPFMFEVRLNMKTFWNFSTSDKTCPRRRKGKVCEGEYLKKAC